MKKPVLTIATRESPLALWQANGVKTQLELAHPYLKIRLLGLTTQADRMPYISLTEMGGKGLFVKELEEALLDGRADIAVHCVKDVPMELPENCSMPVFCQREMPWDVLVANEVKTLKELPPGAIVGSSSVRRQSQILKMRPDLQIHPLRGNINTRLTKLDEKKYAAIILAAAGLIRLNFSHRLTHIFSKEEVLPAVGQGVLGIECRSSDKEIQSIIQPLNHPDTHICVSAERAMATYLKAGCQTPVAGFAWLENKKIILKGLVATPHGETILTAEHSATDPLWLGKKVAEDLLHQGAEAILQACRDSHAK